MIVFFSLAVICAIGLVVFIIKMVQLYDLPATTDNKNRMASAALGALITGCCTMFFAMLTVIQMLSNGN